MPTVTESRPLPHGMRYWHTLAGPINPYPVLLQSVAASSLSDGSQVTTSYRTGARADRLVNEQDPTSAAKIQAGVFSALKSEQHSGEFQTSYDNGHTFSSVSNRVIDASLGSVRGRAGTAYRDYIYWGPLVPRISTMPWSPRGFPGVSTQVTNRTWYEQQAIQQTIPTNPIANVSQALAELVREGIPAVVGSALLGFRDNIASILGGEYLNIKFGWEPLVSELKDLARVVVHADKLIQQLERGSGRNTRRRYHFPPMIDVTKVESPSGGGLHYASGFGPVLSGGTYHPGTNNIQIDRRETNIWFSGCYTYDSHEVFKGQIGRHKLAVRKAQHLLGLDLTPEVVWELAPWSWLTDWFVNIGRNMSQVSRFHEGGLVLRYGYLMVQSTVTRTYVTEGVRFWQNTGTPLSISLVLETTSKQRFRASPYGFALNPSGFSGKQWAILAALGMTKTPNSLRGSEF